MKNHINIKKEKGGKNKKIAQNVGIAVAKTSFYDMLDLNFHSFMTSWDEPILLSRASDNLFIYFSKTPSNIDELKDIAIKSAFIEFNNLKESHVGELPVRTFSDSEVISNIVDISTNNFLMLKQVDFYRENSELKNIDNIWKELFIEKYNTSILKEQSIEKATKIFHKKSVDSNLQEVIVSKIEEFWDSISDLKPMLYSSD